MSDSIIEKLYFISIPVFMENSIIFLMHASNAKAGFPNHSEEYTPSYSPRDVRNDHAIRPEVDIGGLAVVCEVLDVDGLLVQDEDVPGHAVDLDLGLGRELDNCLQL